MSLPVLSRPAADPPTSALPPIPQSRHGRKSLPQTPSRLKTPSRPLAIPSSQGVSSTPELPTLKNIQNGRTGLSTVQTLRKAVSIGQFPQPPESPTSATFAPSASPRKRTSEAGHSSASTTPKLKKAPRHSDGSALYRMSDTPSLLNAGVSSSAVPLVDNKRASDGLSSVPSPPQSRSSSANGSYSTNATTIEEGDDDRGRPKDAAEELQSPKGGKGKEHKGNVIVSVRVRPDSSGHDQSTTEGEWMVDGRRSLIAYRGKEGGDYLYDNVFGTYDDNARVYDSAAKRLVRRVMEGYHGTVFAYGMTGTGKTFSMQGTTTNSGIIPRAITDIFSYIRETPQREFLLRVSYLEIYNEKINDLLATPANGGSTPQEEIKLREDSRRGVYASPLKEEIVQSPTQLLRVIHRGDIARRTGSTQWNARSSRSHAVVQIVVESRERVASGSSPESKRVGMLPSGVRVSTLSLIDLAGSERAADDKERQKEGAHINKSLLTLGTVISKLTSKDKNGNPIDKDGKHLPYRDSKLTRLLQPALSGSSLVSILCTIQIGASGPSTAATTHTMETLNTLKFAARAKNNIVSHAKKATEEVGSGVNAGLLERYRSEIATLRSQLEVQKKSADAKEEKVEEVQLEREAANRHEEQMLEMQLARTALKERIEHLNRLILCSKSTGVNSGMTSALGNHGRLSTGTMGDIGPTRSVRSSASHSTLGTLGPTVSRHPSMASMGATPTFSPVVDDDEDPGELGDGMASLQAQNRALQADLQDKNRYIATLEKRLLQARRSSHSRTSMGFSRAMQDDADTQKQLDEKDAAIADLQKTVAALRSAVRQRSIADMTPESSSAEFKPKKGLHIQLDGEASEPVRSVSLPEPTKSSPGGLSPLTLLLPQKNGDKKRRSVDEMSKMLDEMIQDKVESGHLVKGKSGSVRVPPRSTSSQRRHSRRASSAHTESVPPLNNMISAIRERDSMEEPVSAT
ncbi:Kinesin-like protein kip2 [Knufia obscura]|uniref:Kinesin-like protein n=1 Tax=Knufia obscura TaxID=1635080 RepID=A0ABR0RSX1_9EURO|nr:Kinesin-like protein kip2 [Knufia obscura]